MDLESESQSNVIPFYNPVALRKPNFYVDSSSDLEPGDPYANLSPEKRARVGKEEIFQKTIDKHRKRKEDEDKIRKRAALNR